MLTPIRRPSTGRARVAVAIGTLLVAGGGAVLGFVLERATNAGLGGADRAVVDVNSDLGGGASGAGTGMIITSTGEVLTSNHVIAGAHSVSVQAAATGARFPAAVVGIDPADDVALLQLQNASGLPTVSLGDSSTLSVGSHVTALGRSQGPAALPVELHGAIAALGRTVLTSDPGGANPHSLTGMIEFDIAIAAADCGGPLVDGAGHVVGLDAAEAARVRLPSPPPDTGFAIPINTVMAIVRDIESGRPNPNVLRGQSVVLGVAVDDSVSPPGAVVVRVEFVSPAQAAGIVPRDVIVSLGGTRIGSAAALRRAIQRHRAGDRVDVVWLDPAGQAHSATVQLTTGTV